MDIPALLGAAKVALDMLKLGVDVRDDNKVRDAVTELTNKLFELSMAGFAASQSLNELEATARTLEAKNRELEAKIKERDSYVLHPVKPGSFCYRYKPEADSVQPEHYLCQVCYDKGIKSVLRLHEKTDWSSRHYSCVAGDKSTHDLYF